MPEVTTTREAGRHVDNSSLITDEHESVHAPSDRNTGHESDSPSSLPRDPGDEDGDRHRQGIENPDPHSTQPTTPSLSYKFYDGAELNDSSSLVETLVSTESDSADLDNHDAAETWSLHLERLQPHAPRLDFSFQADIRIDTSVVQYSTSVSPTSSRSGTPGSSSTVIATVPRSGLSAETTNTNQLYHIHMKAFEEMPAKAVSAAAVPGPFIPQTMYRPYTVVDKRRYVEATQLEDPIVFFAEKPDEWGILLTDALHSNVNRLLHRNDAVFENHSPSVSIRLEWPGYGSWNRQIPANDFENPPGPITLQKLAENVSKSVQLFMKDVHAQPLHFDGDVDERWRIGPRHIKFEDLILVSIHHVSMGSWQPHLRLKGALSGHS